ncbi:MAG: glutathione S-transferase family protein [Aestuariibacter sp.]
MYTLYFYPDACSLATHTVLNIINQEVDVIPKTAVENYKTIHPSGLVPALTSGDQTYTEGVSILLYLLDKHENDLLPKKGPARQKVIELMMFANATMHPAYGRLFFVTEHVADKHLKQELLNISASKINQLWDCVENQIDDGPFLTGNTMTPADILLAVYSRWGPYFPVDIKIGPKSRKMIQQVTDSAAFTCALQKENEMVVQYEQK